MSRVEITYFGKRAIVDADQVQKLERKQSLVEQATNLRAYIKADPVGHADANVLLDKVMSKLIRLNRTIRQTVQFVG